MAQVICWNKSLKLPSAVLTTKLSSCYLNRCTLGHTDPQLFVKAKAKDSPHTGVPLAATTEEPYLAIFRFGVGAPPNLSSTMRASAESTETLASHQGSTQILSACPLTPTPQDTCGFHHLAQRSPISLSFSLSPV